MTTDLVTTNGQREELAAYRGVLTSQVLKEAAEQRRLLSEYVKSQMIANTDFGVIPGTPKPTLLKPGAEKLVDLFRCTPKFKLVRVVEDYDRNLFAYTFRVQLYQRDAGAVLAEGYGSANSREGRYRWRQANRKCPKCGKETIIQGKAEYGGGWLCFKKKGGCGAKWDIGAKEIEGQEAGQIENEDVATLANTILKMAKKRALVDGAIALARVSDLFTQDVEDIGTAAAESPSPAQPTRVTVRDTEETTDDKLEENLRATVENGPAGGVATPSNSDTGTREPAPAQPAAPASRSAGAIAHDLIESISRIKNEHHHKNWWSAHEKEWQGLPPPLRKAVQVAYDNAAPK